MADLLSKVKAALGITGTYQDDTLSVYIDEIKEYMLDAGVPEALVNSEVSAGVISRGVTDLWNYNGNAGRLSDYFQQRVAQMVYQVRGDKFIIFTQGDYGISYLVHVCGIEISEDDKLIFSCGSVTKTFDNATHNCILITFTEEESKSFKVGTYKWDLKLQKESALVTVINDGLLIVS